MKDFVTIRVYFEFGQKVNSHSFWKKLKSPDFSSELIKKAKAFGLQQALHLNVSNGYLDNQKIKWGNHEIRQFKHPHLIELTDSESKINQFLEEQKDLFQAVSVIMVKSETLLK